MVMPAALRRLTRSRFYPPMTSHIACVAPHGPCAAASGGCPDHCFRSGTRDLPQWRISSLVVLSVRAPSSDPTRANVLARPWNPDDRESELEDPNQANQGQNVGGRTEHRGPAQCLDVYRVLQRDALVPTQFSQSAWISAGNRHLWDEPRPVGPVAHQPAASTVQYGERSSHRCPAPMPAVLLQSRR